MFRQPGTKVELRGTGFCQGSTVRFGANGASGTPSSIAADGRSLVVEVPRGARQRARHPRTARRPAGRRARPADRPVPEPRRHGLPLHLRLPVREQGSGQATSRCSSSRTRSAPRRCTSRSTSARRRRSESSTARSRPPSRTRSRRSWCCALKGKGKGGLCYGNSRTVGDIATGDSAEPVHPRGREDARTRSTARRAPAAALLTRIGERHLTQFGAKVITAQVDDVLGGASPAQHAATIRARALAELTNGDPAARRTPADRLDLRRRRGHALPGLRRRRPRQRRVRPDRRRPEHPVRRRRRRQRHDAARPTS